MSNVTTRAIAGLCAAFAVLFLSCSIGYDEDAGYYLAAKHMMATSRHHSETANITCRYGNEIADIAVNCVSMTNTRNAGTGNGTVSEFEMNKLGAELHHVFYIAGREQAQSGGKYGHGVKLAIANMDATLSSIMRKLNFNYTEVVRH